MFFTDREPADDKKALEESVSYSEASVKEDFKKPTDTVPTELERLKVFSQKIARCAAKSFCETYVQPLVLQNPSPLPSKSTTAMIHKTLQEGQTSAILLPRQEDNEILLNPIQEKDQTEMFEKQENKEESRQSEKILRLKTDTVGLQTATISNPNKENQKIAQELKMKTDKKQQNLIDFGSIMSYIPRGLMAVSDLEEEPPEYLDGMF